MTLICIFCLTITATVYSEYLYADPIFIDFGRLSTWNCPTDSPSNRHENEVDSQKAYDTVNNRASDEVDDLDSEPSINLRRKFKGINNTAGDKSVNKFMTL